MALIFSHAGCADGTFATHATLQAYPGARVKYVQAGTLTNERIKAELKEEKTLIILDIRVENFQPIDQVQTIIIDHHVWDKPAQSDIFIYDKTQCASVLAWKHFIKTEPPKLLEYIQDRDLFAQKLEHTNAIMSVYYLLCQKKTTQQLLDEFDEQKWIEHGKILMEQRNQAIQNMVKRGIPCRFKAEVLPEKYKVLLMRGDSSLKSDAGNEAVKLDYDIGIFYEYAPEVNELWLSFRSKDPVDVNELCKHITNKSGIGGGHKKASGATIDQTSQFFATPVTPANWFEVLFERI